MLEALERLDRSLFLRINSRHSPFMDEFMWIMSQSWHTILICIVAAFFFYRRYALKKTIEFIVVLTLLFSVTDFTSNRIKHALERYRPTHNIEIMDQVHTVNGYTGGKYGFVSGHSANSFGVIAFIVLCLKGKRNRLLPLIFIYPCLIAYSRVYLGVHYPADVAMGGIFGLFTGILAFYLVRSYLFRFNDKAA